MTARTPDVSILIVSYETRDLLRDCLRSVYEQTRGMEFEVLVLDNASSDGSAAMVAAEFPQVGLRASAENLGFARGNNVLAEQARGDYVLLLNPDTVVLDGAVQRLVRFAREHPDGGLYGGRTLRPGGGVDPSSCWGAPTLWSLVCFATGLSTAFPRNRWLDPDSIGRWERDSVRRVGIVTGCLALLPRSLWQRLGGFDEGFWMYGEDADLSLRVAAAGFSPVITPDATIVHVVGASSAPGRKGALVMRSKIGLLQRHWTPGRRRLGQALLLSGVALRAGLERVLKRRTGPWSEVWHLRREWLEGYPRRSLPRPATP